MLVLPAAYSMCSRCLRRPEERSRCPGTRVTEGCEHLCGAGIEPGSFERAAVLLTAGPSLQPLDKCYELVFNTQKLEAVLLSKPSVFDLSRKSKLWQHWICLLSHVSWQEPGSSCLPHTELLGSYVFFFSCTRFQRRG